MLSLVVDLVYQKRKINEEVSNTVKRLSLSNKTKKEKNNKTTAKMESLESCKKAKKLTNSQQDKKYQS